MKALTHQWKDETGAMQKKVYPGGETEYRDQADRLDPPRVQRREDDRAKRAAKQQKPNP